MYITPRLHILAKINLFITMIVESIISFFSPRPLVNHKEVIREAIIALGYEELTPTRALTEEILNAQPIEITDLSDEHAENLLFNLTCLLVEGVSSEDVEKILRNMSDQGKRKLCNMKFPPSKTLVHAFIWEDSPEGEDYWRNIYLLIPLFEYSFEEFVQILDSVRETLEEQRGA